MSRPSLTPMTYCEFDRPRDRSWRWFLWNLLRILRATIRAPFRLALRAVTVDLTSGGLRKTLPLRVVIIGAMMKLAWLPPAIVVACGWAVYQQTRGPAPAGAGADVARITNAFSERVSFASSDGIQLSGIWVPSLNVKEIVDQGDEMLERRHAAIVLVHDHGQDGRQMLAQAALLHELGLHVLVLETRGAGQSEKAPRTYGRKERLDVAAAIEFVAARATVDTERIAVWAVGSGAEAAAAAPTTIPVALLISESNASQSVVDARFMPSHEAYDPLRPVCRWLFNVMYAGGAADLATGNPPRRVVELESGQMDRALEELRAFGSVKLVSPGLQ